MYGMSKEKFDLWAANKYVSKSHNAKSSKIAFSLSFTSMKNMLRAKKCYYTGLPLTKDTVTIDRIDNSKGYCSGNVVSCHTSVNSLKALIENGNNAIGLKQVKMMVNKWEKRL